jgi:hypothetical protein
VKEILMKNILVLIHDDSGQEARIQAALDVARAVRGHLTCLDITAIMPFVDESIGVSGGATLMEMERLNECANRARLEPRIRNEDVPSNWIETTDYLEPARARLLDRWNRPSNGGAVRGPCRNRNAAQAEPAGEERAFDADGS